MYIAALGTIRTETGITAEALSDEGLRVLVNRLESKIENWTDHWFESRTRTYYYEISRDTDKIVFPAPVVALTSMTVNSVAADLANYRVPDLTDSPDGRRYPRIIANSSTYAWSEGDAVTIVGSFGFVEADGSVPLQIQELLFGLVRREWRMKQANNPGQSHRMEHVKSLSVAGQATKFANSRPTGDPELDEIIASYTRVGLPEVV